MPKVAVSRAEVRSVTFSSDEDELVASSISQVWKRQVNSLFQLKLSEVDSVRGLMIVIGKSWM